LIVLFVENFQGRLGQNFPCRISPRVSKPFELLTEWYLSGIFSYIFT
jgi:hypothetical protein